MSKLTYNNLVELKSKASDAIVNWRKYDDEVKRLRALEKYVDFFNDFRDEAFEQYLRMLTVDDFTVAYDSLWELSVIKWERTI